MQITFLNNNLSYYKNNRQSQPAKVSTPDNFSLSFKGKTDTFISRLIKIFTKTKESQSVQALNTVNITEPIEQTGIRIKQLPFDARARLQKLGIDGDIADSFLKTCGTNKEHFAKLVNMYKGGFEPKLIPVIFEHSKSNGNKLATNFYFAAFNLKDKVAHKHLPAILDNFKLSTIKFDYQGFADFEKLKFAAHTPASKERAFKFMMPEDIDDYFYYNISAIKKTAGFLGEENFMKLYSLDFEKMNTVIEQTPALIQIPKNNRNLFSLLEQKIKQNTSDNIEYENRIDTLIRLFDLIPLSIQNSKQNMGKKAEIVSLISNL